MKPLLWLRGFVMALRWALLPNFRLEHRWKMFAQVYMFLCRPPYGDYSKKGEK